LTKRANIEDPETIARSSKMIGACPDLMDLVQEGKLFIMHILQNSVDFLMAHEDVLISKNFDKGFTEFVQKQRLQRRLDYLENEIQDLKTSSVVKLYRFVCSIIHVLLNLAFLLYSFFTNKE
jgi:hypothetical protein